MNRSLAADGKRWQRRQKRCFKRPNDIVLSNKF